MRLCFYNVHFSGWESAKLRVGKFPSQEGVYKKCTTNISDSQLHTCYQRENDDIKFYRELDIAGMSH